MLVEVSRPAGVLFWRDPPGPHAPRCPVDNDGARPGGGGPAWAESWAYAVRSDRESNESGGVSLYSSIAAAVKFGRRMLTCQYLPLDGTRRPQNQASSSALSYTRSTRQHRPFLRGSVFGPLSVFIAGARRRARPGTSRTRWSPATPVRHSQWPARSPSCGCYSRRKISPERRNAVCSRKYHVCSLFHRTHFARVVRVLDLPNRPSLRALPTAHRGGCCGHPVRPHRGSSALRTGVLSGVFDGTPRDDAVTQ